MTLPITGPYLPFMRSEPPALMPLFRSRRQAELLTWLYLHPHDEYSVTDLAARLGVPLTTLHREVSRMTDAALIRSRPVGRNRMLQANLSHPAAAPLTKLLEVTFGPGTVIADEFATLGAERVLIFGSWAARYDGESGPPPNDIDVLVIGTPSRTDVYDAADRAADRLGLQVNPVLRTHKQWSDSSDRLSAQIKASPTVDVSSFEANASPDTEEL